MVSRAVSVITAVDGGGGAAGLRRWREASVGLLATLVLAGILLGSPGTARAALS
jgi:hypothetical protein